PDLSNSIPYRPALNTCNLSIPMPVHPVADEFAPQQLPSSQNLLAHLAPNGYGYSQQSPSSNIANHFNPMNISEKTREAADATYYQAHDQTVGSKPSAWPHWIPADLDRSNRA